MIHDLIERYLLDAWTEFVSTDDAEQLLFRLRAMREALGMSRPDIASHLPPLLLQTLGRWFQGIEDFTRRQSLVQIVGSWLASTDMRDAAEFWLRLAVLMAEGINDPLIRCNAFTGYSDLMRCLGNREKALEWAERAVQEADASPDSNIRCITLFSFADLLHELGRSDDALREAERAVQVADTLFDTGIRSGAYYTYAKLLNLAGRDDVALNWARQAAIDALDLHDLPHPQCNAFYCYAEVLRSLRQYPEALPWALRAAQQAERLSDPVVRCNAFSTAATVLHILGHYDEALSKAEMAVCEAAHVQDSHTRCNAVVGYIDVLRTLSRCADALPWATLAVDEAAVINDPYTRCRVWEAAGLIHFLLAQFERAFELLIRAKTDLAETIRRNRWPAGIERVLDTYNSMFDVGLSCSELLFAEQPQDGILWTGLEFLDGLKAVWIREGLRRISTVGVAANDAPTWRPGPANWTEMFDPVISERDKRKSFRGFFHSPKNVADSDDVAPSQPTTSPVLELPQDRSQGKAEFVKQITASEVLRLLPDRDTVLVNFHFVGDDLFLVPVRKRANGAAEVLHPREGYLKVLGILSRMTELVSAWRRILEVIVRPDKCGVPGLDDLDPDTFIGMTGTQLRHELAVLAGKPDPADLSVEPQAGLVRDPEDIVTEIGEIIRLDELLTLIEPDRSRWECLHLVILPDGPLYQLPIHAARVPTEGKKALIDVVSSVRFGLSLGTLLMQKDIEDAASADDRRLRGLLFATQGNEHTGRLGYVSREVNDIVNTSPEDCWRIFGEHGDEECLATRANLFLFHRTPNLLWACAHGGPFTDTIELSNGETRTGIYPALLLRDGPLSTARLVAEGYDLRALLLWNMNCCVLGRLDQREHNRQVQGFVAALVLIGLRRVSSASWELADHASAAFAGFWMAALARHVFEPAKRSPHAFAIALKQALCDFRCANDGQFDHEYFWAPYTLYGLG